MSSWAPTYTTFPSGEPITSSVCSPMAMFRTTCRVAVSMTCTSWECGLSTRSQFTASAAKLECAANDSNSQAKPISGLRGMSGSQAVDQLHEVLDVALVVLVMQEAGAQRHLPANARGGQVRLPALAHCSGDPLVERIERGGAQ